MVKSNKVGIVLVATNAYFVLGIKFIKRFIHFHDGDDHVKFYFFSDTDPEEYLPPSVDIQYINTNHDSWRDATNSKFENILKLPDECDYLFYFDADTSVNQTFTCRWMLGDLVGGEHYGNRDWMKQDKGYDRNPKSKAFVSRDTKLFQMYYYGAFFGGRNRLMKQFCETLYSWQLHDKSIGYEPGCNDESYINAYFHYNKPHVIVTEMFKFSISDKSGIGETRDVNLDISQLKKQLLEHRHDVIEIQHGKLYF